VRTALAFARIGDEEVGLVKFPADITIGRVAKVALPIIVASDLPVGLTC
jgi:hypothetical protein